MVDILMATYNGEKYIKEQIDSILNQTYSDFVLHISDDGSSDNTINIIKDYAKKDSRIKLHIQKKNLGYIKNFEYLISVSTSDYLMMCDQDDVWMNTKVEDSVNYLEENKKDMAICDMEVVDENLAVMNQSYFDYINLNISDDLEFKDFLFRNPCAGCALIFRKKLVKKILPFPELKAPYYIHDWYLLMMGASHGKVGFLKKSLSKYRQHSNNNVGMNKKFKTGFNYFLTARQINFNYRIEFSNLLKEKVNKKNIVEIDEFISYLSKTKNSKFINLRFKDFKRFTKIVGIKPKIKYLTHFHFPLFILSFKEAEND